MIAAVIGSATCMIGVALCISILVDSVQYVIAANAADDGTDYDM